MISKQAGVLEAMRLHHLSIWRARVGRRMSQHFLRTRARPIDNTYACMHDLRLIGELIVCMSGIRSFRRPSLPSFVTRVRTERKQQSPSFLCVGTLFTSIHYPCGSTNFVAGSFRPNITFLTRNHRVTTDRQALLASGQNLTRG